MDPLDFIPNDTSFDPPNLPPINDIPFPSEVLFTIYGDSHFSSHRIAWVRLCLIFLYTSFSVIGVTTNAVVVFLLLCWNRKSLRNITNRFVLALAISDILMSSFNMSIQAYYELHETVYFSDLTCRLVFSTFGLPMHISCLVILVIAIDRYRIIVHPLRRRMSRLAATLTLLSIVLISFIAVIPIAVFSKNSQAKTSLHGPRINEREYHYCVEHWPTPEIRLCYTVFTFLVQFLLPLLLTGILYTRIYFRLHERRFRKRDLERKKRTNKILVAIVICFFICWTPWNIFSIILEVHGYIVHKRNPELLDHNASEAKVLAFKQLLATIFQEAQNDSFNETTHTEQGLAISEIVPQSLLLFGGHAKLIDLLLKLLAMCSGCLNPCLYGCMTDTMRLLLKRAAARLRAIRSKSFSRTRCSFRGYPIAMPSENSTPNNAGFHNSKSFGASIYCVHCCGFQVIFRAGFHQHCQQVKRLFQKSDNLHHTPDPTTSSTKGRRRQNDAVASMVCVDNASDANDYNGDDGPANLPQIVAHAFHHLDPASLTFNNRESGNLSIEEFSTKRTSLLPSSVYDKTPRNSFMAESNRSNEPPRLLQLGQNAQPPENSPLNRIQTVVNIEVHPQPFLQHLIPQCDPFRRKSSSKFTSKTTRVLAPLEEVSCAIGDPVVDLKPAIRTAATERRDIFKRSVSISYDSEKPPKRGSKYFRRQSTYDSLQARQIRKQKTQISPDSTSIISDDFAHFHKTVLQEERLKESMAPRKSRKGPSIRGNNPRRQSLYSHIVGFPWASKSMNPSQMNGIRQESQHQLDQRSDHSAGKIEEAVACSSSPHLPISSH